MTDFDPGAYLTESNTEPTFDPGAYLSQPTPASQPAVQPNVPTAISVVRRNPSMLPSNLPSSPASAGELTQAAASGVNAGAYDIAGIPMDAATNAANLLKAGIGYPYSKLTGQPVPSWLQADDPANVPGTSEWLKRKTREAGGANLIDTAPNQSGQDLSALHTAGETVGPVPIAGAAGSRVPKTTAQLTDEDTLLKKSQELGYVVPPATSNPTLTNKLAEGFAGKLTTAQAASVKNMEVTNSLVRDELGLPKGTPLTHETLNNVRLKQSPAYEAVKAIPDIKFGADYEKELDALTGTANKITSALPNYKATGSEQVKSLVDSLKPTNGVMDGEVAVELSKSLRAEAASQEQLASRSGDPTARTLARAYRGAGEAVENAIESHLNSIGKPELAKNWDDARRTIAKTYSVENALDGAGNVDATKLGKQLIKGKPLSGNLEAAANFANAYPKAARVIKESMPGMSPLDVYGGAAMEAVSGNPAALLIGPGRMATRAGLLSPLGQRMGIPSGHGPTLPTNMQPVESGIPSWLSVPAAAGINRLSGLGNQ
jgi:hypothetical protein